MNQLIKDKNIYFQKIKLHFNYNFASYTFSGIHG